jgi:hypothetical protein
MALAWFTPSFINKSKTWYNNWTNKREPVNKQKSPSVEAAEKYLEEMAQMPSEKIGEILGIDNSSINISGYEIVNSTGNNENARVDVRIYIVNSFTEKALYLSRNNDLWVVERIEGASDLYYEKNGFLIKHNSNWEAYSSNNNSESSAEWTLNNTDEDNQIIFFVEEKSGNYSTAFTNCSTEGISECKEEILGENKYYSATYMGQIKTYVLEGTKDNLIILTMGKNAPEEKAILASIKVE